MKTFLFLFSVLLSFGLTSCSDSGPPPRSNTQHAGQQENGQGESSPRTPTFGVQGDSAVPVVLDENLLRSNLVLVFDCSYSMVGDKIAQAKTAIATYLKTVPEDVNVGLVTFGRDGIREKVSLGTGNREHLVSEVDAMQAGGGTPLAESVGMAYQLLDAQAKKQLGYGEYHLVVITDGVADNERSLASWVEYILEESPVQIFTIGFQVRGDHSLNQPGQTRYVSADDEAGLQKGLEKVLAESDSFDISSFK